MNASDFLLVLGAFGFDVRNVFFQTGCAEFRVDIGLTCDAFPESLDFGRSDGFVRVEVNAIGSHVEKLTEVIEVIV